MPGLTKLLPLLRNLEKDELEVLIKAAQGHLDNLNRPKGILNLVMVDGEYILRLSGTSKGVKLGPPLTPAASLRQATTPAPVPADFEIPKDLAKKQMNEKPESVGWWEVDGQIASRRYYQLEPYHAARSAWHEHHKRASDPLALAYHLPVESVKKVRELEEEGFTIQLPD